MNTSSIRMLVSKRYITRRWFLSKFSARALIVLVLKGEVDGFAVAREIHSRFEIPSIYMTGLPVAMIKERALVPEPYECLVKPVADSELKEKINSVLQKQNN